MEQKLRQSVCVCVFVFLRQWVCVLDEFWSVSCAGTTFYSMVREGEREADSRPVY